MSTIFTVENPAKLINRNEKQRSKINKTENSYDTYETECKRIVQFIENEDYMTGPELDLDISNLNIDDLNELL